MKETWNMGACEPVCPYYWGLNYNFLLRNNRIIYQTYLEKNHDHERIFILGLFLELFYYILDMVEWSIPIAEWD